MTGTLNIVKDCSEPCPSATFPITVTGNSPVPPFSLSDGESQAVTLSPGSFTVHESVPSGFATPNFEGGCRQTPGTSDATGTISAGQTLTCTIVNISNG